MKATESEVSIAIDMDGVLTDPGNAILQEMSRRPHLAHLVTAGSYYNLKSSEFEQNFPAEYQQEIEGIARAAGFFRALSPIPGAIAALESFVAAGIRPWILTSPFRNNPTQGQLEKSAWLGEHVYSRVGHQGISGVLYTNHKERLTFDYVIEDRPHKYYPLHLRGKLPWTLITLAQPWNEEDPNPLRISWLRIDHPARYHLKRPGEYYADVFASVFGIEV